MMRALILNSGIGKRMRHLTSDRPKCMTVIYNNETIVSRQLKQLYECGIHEVVMTTGPFEKDLVNYCRSLELPINYVFVNNFLYDKTNYIYSIYLAREFINDDIVMMHGDLVFELGVLQNLISQDNSYMAISTAAPIPEKDFKAVVKEGVIRKIGVEFFDDVVAAQPLYKIKKNDWKVWLDAIVCYCESGKVSCYAENAFNEISEEINIYPMDFNGKLCMEIDTPEDLAYVREKLNS